MMGLVLLILLGAGQGLILSTFLLLKPENRNANRWLAFLIIVVSIHLLEYASDTSGFSLQHPWIVASTYPLLFCMGPFYYFFCRHLIGKNYGTSFSASF